MREYREESRRLEQRECVSDSNALHKSFEFDAARIMQVKFPISSRSICLKIAIGISSGQFSLFLWTFLSAFSACDCMILSLFDV